MTKNVIKQFGEHADEYYHSRYHSQGSDLNKLVELASPQRDQIALDLATGAGHTAFAIARRAGRVIASDITVQMIERARKAADDGNIRNVDFLLCDAHAIPYSDESLDIVTCRAAPHHFKDVPLAVKEAFRVVRSGGRMVIIDGAAPEDQGLHEFLDRLEIIRDPSHNRRLSLSEWNAAFENAGFELENSYLEDDIYDFDDWVTRAGVKYDVHKRLEDMIINATPEQHAYFKFDIQDGKVVSMRNDRAVVLGRKPKS